MNRKASLLLSVLVCCLLAFSAQAQSANVVFEGDILSGATVVRTITMTVETFDYSAADQTTDFGSPQASIDIEIFQISALVGRGRVRAQTV